MLRWVWQGGPRRRLVLRHRAAVERVAAALSRRGTLTGRQIDALVRA